MPGDRKHTRSKKKVRTTKRKTNNWKNRHTRANTVVSLREAFPKRLFVPMVYSSDLITLTCTVGAGAYHLMSQNSLYDPDITGSGHQPYGFDQWSAMYNYYRVHAFKMKMCAVNQTDTQPITIVFNTNSVTSGPTDIDTAKETPNAITRRGGANKTPVCLETYRTLAFTCGVPKRNVATDDLFRAAVNTSPSIQRTMQVWAQPFDQATTVTVKFEIKIKYYSEFYGPKNVSQS